MAHLCNSREKINAEHHRRSAIFYGIMYQLHPPCGRHFFLRDLFTDFLYLRAKLLKCTDDVRLTDITVAIYQNRHNNPITFT